MIRQKTALILIMLLFFTAANSANSWIQPFKMGQGRFLDNNEIKAFLDDINNSQPETFKKSFSETLRSLNVSPFDNSNKDKYQVIEFTKFEIKVSGLAKSKGHGPYFMICINCNEGIPDAELAKRQKTKNKYYDIWVLSGSNILLERDGKTKEYRILSSGFAE